MTVTFGSDTSSNAAGAPAAGIDESTPWMAAADGDLLLLQTSLQTLNMTVNQSDQHGYTLLHAAASYSQFHIMQWLLEQSVNVNDVDQEGDSALHYASTLAAAKFLVEVAAIDVSLVNTKGRTALNAKQDELNDMMHDADDEEEEFDPEAEDALNLRQIIEYLQGLSTRGQ